MIEGKVYETDRHLVALHARSRRQRNNYERAEKGPTREESVTGRSISGRTSPPLQRTSGTRRGVRIYRDDPRPPGNITSRCVAGNAMTDTRMERKKLAATSGALNGLVYPAVWRGNRVRQGRHQEKSTIKAEKKRD